MCWGHTAAELPTPSTDATEVWRLGQGLVFHRLQRPRKIYFISVSILQALTTELFSMLQLTSLRPNLEGVNPRHYSLLRPQAQALIFLGFPLAYQ